MQVKYFYTLASAFQFQEQRFHHVKPFIAIAVQNILTQSGNRPTHQSNLRITHKALSTIFCIHAIQSLSERVVMIDRRQTVTLWIRTRPFIL